MTPNDIARLSGCSPRTVHRFLRDRFPDHTEGAWWRFSEDEGARLIAELRGAKRQWYTQPRRALSPSMTSPK